ncbi:transglycosylase SLT domain-containing protein [Paraherbaspirillum soli]|uniref:Transglycosylase SLT domain-containing protein n=1 Tax=Paraherbaspirillum soli TaxID=631222 RepID=A0ABW0MAX5_9BURK
MLARSIKALPGGTTFAYSKQFKAHSANWASVTGNSISGFIAATRITVLLTALLAIATVAAVLLKPSVVDQLKTTSLFASTQNVTPAVNSQPDLQAQKQVNPTSAADTTRPAQLVALSDKVIKPVDNSRQQQWVTSWLSKRYRVAGDATNVFVSTAYKTARETKLDPLLILAVMAIESGLNPFAESPVGAQGLMQVMSKVHEEKFENLGGIKAALTPAANIKVGSMILKDYVTQGGSVEAGLKRYVGAAAFANDGGYGSKVLAEYRRLQEVATGKKVPLAGNITTPMATPKSRPLQAASPADANRAPAEA